MLSSFLAAAAVCHAYAVRPERMGAKTMTHTARVGDLLEPAGALAKSKSPSEALAAVKAASGVVNSILLQSGNATAHMSEGDQKLLKQVIELMDQSIYGSMNASHAADDKSLASAIADIEQCNTNIANRQAADGDLGLLHQSVSSKQGELNDLQDIVDKKTTANISAWKAFRLHMDLIQPPPKVPEFPSRTMGALDVYFESSPFCLWYDSQQDAYVIKRDKFVAADLALKQAIEAYGLGKAKRDVQYCDWKTELEGACTAFDECYSTKSTFYTNELKPRVKTDMEARIEAYKAGETLIQQIKFLLGTSKTRETPPVSATRYTMDFPPVPSQGTCDLSPLSSSEWVPAVDCWEPQPDYTSCPSKGGKSAKCTKWKDTLPGSPLRGGSHTVVMSLEMGARALSARNRQWMFNLGQEGQFADHWLFNAHHSSASIQFGAWSGAQIGRADISTAHTLVTTYDSSTKDYTLYINGALSQKRSSMHMDIKNGQMLIGMLNGHGADIDFQGCVDSVDVYRHAMTASQVKAASDHVKTSCSAQ